VFRFVFNFSVLTVCFIIFMSQQSFAAKECLSNVIDKQVDEMYGSLEKTPYGQGILQRVDEKISEGVIDAEHKEAVLRANLEMSVRKESGCSIPKDLQSNVTKFFKSADKEERDHCGDNKFLQKAKKEYRKMKKEKDYKNYEEMMLAQIQLAINNPASQAKFRKKWENQSFKDKVIMTVIRVNLREEDGCKNPGLPMAEIVHEMM